MANIFGRQQTDASNTATFALPASASSSTNQATPFDLGAEPYKTENVEVEISVPALSTTIAPDTRTVTYILETCTATNFSTIDQTLYSETFTGAGGAGVAAQTKIVRIPSNCARYLRGKVTFGASTTTGAALSATVKILT